MLDLLQLSDDPDVFAAYDPSQNSYCDVDFDREVPAVVCNGHENGHVADVVADIQDELGYELGDEVFVNNTAPLPANTTSDGSVNVITGLYVEGLGEYMRPPRREERRTDYKSGLEGPLKGSIAELSALIEMDISSNGISRFLQPGVSISISMHATAPGGAED